MPITNKTNKTKREAIMEMEVTMEMGTEMNRWTGAIEQKIRMKKYKRGTINRRKTK